MHIFFQGDEVILGNFADGPTSLTLRIAWNTLVRTAGDVGLGPILNDGFRDREDMLIRMRDYYPDFGPQTAIAVIWFEPVEDESFRKAVAGRAA